LTPMPLFPQVGGFTGMDLPTPLVV
jgi:hypothetical protein